MIDNLDTVDTTSANVLKWLIKLEQVNNPHFNHALLLNIFKVHKNIKDVQVITDTNYKRMLVFLELSWFGRKFRKAQIHEQVSNMLNEVIPSYDFRIIFDKNLFDKALELANDRK